MTRVELENGYFIKYTSRAGKYGETIHASMYNVFGDIITSTVMRGIITADMVRNYFEAYLDNIINAGK